MRLAEIVRVRGKHIEIPPAFQQPLELRPGSAVFVYSADSEAPSEPRDSKEVNLIITTIPRRCWPRIIKLSCLLGHTPGSLHEVCALIKRVKGNILIMEGSGQKGAGDSWWSGVIDFPNVKSASELSESMVALINELSWTYKEKEALEKEEGGIWPFSDAFLESGAPRLADDLPGRGIVVNGAPPSRQYPFLVDRMRLSDLAESVRQDGSSSSAREFRKGRVPFDFSMRTKLRHGLLLCDTDEKFLRFVETHVPAQIDLPIETRGEPTKVGIGALESLTAELKQQKVDLIYTYNYISDRSVTDARRSIERERSQVRFFANTSDMPVNRLAAEAYIKEWQQHFEALLATSRKGNEPPLVVDPQEARLRVWHDSKLFVFKARPDRTAVRMNVVQRLSDEKERSNVPLRSVVAVLAVLLVGLGAAIGWPFLRTEIAPSIFSKVGDMAGVTIATAIGGALAFLFQEWRLGGRRQ